MQVQVNLRPHYIEIIAITDVVTAPKLSHLVDVLADELERNLSRNVLVEVRAQSRDIPLLETFSLLAHAVKRRIYGTRIAYVVTGRPLLSITRFYEDAAARRGVKMKFFTRSTEALDWLRASEEASIAT